MDLSNPRKTLVRACSVVIATGFLASTLPLPAAAAPLDGAAGPMAALQDPTADGPGAGEHGEATTSYAPSLDESTDRIIVKFEDDAAPVQRDAVVAEVAADDGVSAESLEPLKETVGGALVLEADQMLGETELEQTIEALEADPAVEYAEPDYIINAPQAATPRNPPNDPYYAGYQWNMRAIDAAGAWRYATGEGGVSVSQIPLRPGTLSFLVKRLPVTILSLLARAGTAMGGTQTLMMKAIGARKFPLLCGTVPTLPSSQRPIQITALGWLALPQRESAARSDYGC